MAPTATGLDETARTSFYQAAIAGIAALEQQADKPYYTGSERSSQWNFFAGHLDASDRLDLVVRDAAVRHPAAFAPRDVFRLLDLPDDEPFGPRWSSPYGRDTGKVAWQSLQDALDKPADELWDAAVIAWDLDPSAGAPQAIGEAERVVLIGWPAICGVARGMFTTEQSDWSPRVLISIAESPGARQAAGLAPVCLGDRSGQKGRIAAPCDLPGLDPGTGMESPDLAEWLGGRPYRIIPLDPLTDSEQQALALLSE